MTNEKVVDIICRAIEEGRMSLPRDKISRDVQRLVKLIYELHGKQVIANLIEGKELYQLKEQGMDESILENTNNVGFEQRIVDMFIEHFGDDMFMETYTDYEKENQGVPVWFQRGDGYPYHQGIIINDNIAGLILINAIDGRIVGETSDIHERKRHEMLIS